MAQAMFGAGCFWGVESTFRAVQGVDDITVGYSGGHVENPSYRQVCGGDTGHAEVVLVSFDPEVVSYPELLKVFWGSHDPTTPNRQGPDVGAQYRSAIFYFDQAQKDQALAQRDRLQAEGRFDRPIVTEITAAPAFYPAEQYHQRYFEKHRLAHG